MALAVDCDPGQSPFKADWDSVGQCEMDWDNAYPWIFMALASLGRLGQRGILGQSSILDNLQGRPGTVWTGAGLGQWIPIGYSWHWMDTHRIFMALASLRRLGQLESWDNLGS